MSAKQDAINALEHAIALRDVASGTPVLTDAELDDYLAASTPIAFWRRRAGKTQAGLASAVGISQAFLAQIEKGNRGSRLDLHVRLADALGLRVEDLAAES